MAQSDGLLCTTYYDVLLRIPIKMGKAQMHISIPDHYRIDVATEHPDFNILSLIFVTLDPLPGTKCEACRFCGCARLFFFCASPSFAPGVASSWTGERPVSSQNGGIIRSPKIFDWYVVCPICLWGWFPPPVTRSSLHLAPRICKSPTWLWLSVCLSPVHRVGMFRKNLGLMCQ